MAWVKKIFTSVWYVFVSRLVLFLVTAFFMALGFLMGVLTISFALPIDLYKTLWISKNEKMVSLQRFYFKRY